MKVYTVLRQNKIDYDFSVELLKGGCFIDKAKAIALAKAEYESMQAEYEDQMLKYSDKDIYDPDEHDSGALYTEEDDECGFYLISFGNDEHYESHCVWVDEWDVDEQRTDKKNRIKKVYCVATIIEDGICYWTAANHYKVIGHDDQLGGFRIEHNYGEGMIYDEDFDEYFVDVTQN